MLDHNVPQAHRLHVPEDCEVYTTQYMGWKDLENGVPIEVAEKAAFSVLITLDQNLPHQQDLASCQVGIVILAARPAELSNLIELMPQLENVLPEAAKGRHMTVFGTPPPTSSPPSPGAVRVCRRPRL